MPSVPSLIRAWSPLAYYRLGESGAEEPADDLGAYTATLDGATTWGATGALTGDTDTALTLAGGSFTFTPRPILDESQTRIAWVRTTGTDATRADDADPAMPVWADTDGDVTDSFGVTDGFVEYRRYDGTSWQSVLGDTSVNDGDWHMIAVVYNHDNGSVALFVDGTLDTLGSITPHVSTAGVTAVGRGFGASDTFPGDLDEVAVFNQTVPDSVIEAMWEASLVPPPLSLPVGTPSMALTAEPAQLSLAGTGGMAPSPGRGYAAPGVVRQPVPGASEAPAVTVPVSAGLGPEPLPSRARELPEVQWTARPGRPHRRGT